MSFDLSPVVSGLPSTASPTLPDPAPTRRLGSIDAYRGLVMFLMMAEVLRFCAVASAVPGNTIWAFLCHHQSHVEWIGCVLHDMIQPSFSFLVGVALPFSLARGQSPGKRRRMRSGDRWSWFSSGSSSVRSATGVLGVGSSGRVDLGGCPPKSPTDPGLHITRTRFLIS
ncbi:hypothetical protein [Mycobacterium sp.]|uniref:hypothetical protein n=1 Tax=Mycobacterium sp. TaxID=1785 RepID=UPI003F9D7006